MSTEVLAASLLAGVQATFGQGRIWYLKAATAPLTITAEKQGSGANVRKFINVGAGMSFKADPGDGWTYLRVLSTVSQNIEIIVGDDEVQVASAVSVNGNVTVQVLPSATVETPAWVAILTLATNTTLIPQNLTRKRIRVGHVASSLADTVRVQKVGAAAGSGLELVPGTWEPFDTTAALQIYNPEAVTATVWVLEET